MSRLLGTVALVVFFGAVPTINSPQGKAGQDARSGKAPQGRAVTLLAQGAWPWVPVYAPDPLPRSIQQLVIRSQGELEKLAGPGSPALVAQGLHVAALDFRKQMLVAVADGTQPLVGVSGGGPPSAPLRVRVVAVEVDGTGRRLTVRWARVPRARDEVLTHPLEAVLVERFPGAVRFERLPDGKVPARGPKAVRGTPSKILARGFWPDGRIAAAPPRQWVVRSQADLVDARLKANEEVIERMRRAQAQKYAQALGVGAVDFRRQMVIGVSAGVRRTGGYRVEILRVKEAGGVLTVHWKLHVPRRGRPVASAPTHPAAVALVPRRPGEVRFVPPAGQGEGPRQGQKPRSGQGRGVPSE